MGLEQLNFDGKNKVEVAIELLQACEPQEGYYLAFSGGKDSIVIYDLAVKSGIKFDAHYCVSPIDPIEIHQFIKHYYPTVAWDYHARGFWKKVHRYGLPTRRYRWCCRFIKEAGGIGRTVIVGNRSDEGSGRSKQKCFDKSHDGKKILLRPIICWNSNEVWEYIDYNNLDYCSLYDEGFNRIGCVLCPFNRDKTSQIEKFPAIVKLWRLACDHIVKRRLEKGKDDFKTGQELWDWWFSNKKAGQR